MPNEQDHIGRTGAAGMGTMQTTPSTIPPTMAADEEVPADVDEPPEQGRTPRPAPLKIQHSSTFTKISSKPNIDRKTSLLTTALQSASNTSSPVDADSDRDPPRGMSCISTWSNSTISTAGLTSDEGFTSPGTRTCTPSPPLPSTMIHTMLPPFTQKPSEQRLKFAGQENDTIAAPKPTTPAGEQGVEATLGRKRCIMFACGGKKEEKKPVEAPVAKPATPPSAEEPPKRACTIKFACAKPAATPAPAAEEPAKRLCSIKFACPAPKSTEADSKPKTPRRPASPAPPPREIPVSPKASYRAHRDSDSTVRNNSPISVRKVSMVDRTRRLSQNAELAHTEAYRFHEFASSEEEVEEWTQEVTCHRNRLTVGDTLRVENNLRQLVEEVEEEALEDDEDDAADDEDDDDDDDEDEDNSDAYSDVTDEGFQTDDEEGFAVSDDDSDAGSDYNWWAPGRSTAATSIDHIGTLRPKNHRTVSESSIGSLESRKNGLKMFEREEGQRADGPSAHSVKRKKSKPVNIRVPEPELPDSTDFVCGTLDEDRPAEEAYMSNLERRRAAKHKPAPQDIDPSFPASDPELVDDEEDEADDIENPSESDNYFMMHGRMDIIDGAPRGRRRDTLKQRSPPAHSPKRLRSPAPVKRTVHRSPPPPTKRAVHRSPPPPTTKRTSHRSPPPSAKKAVHRSPPPSRTLFGKSPVRARSPAPTRLRSPPPSRRGSANILAQRQRSDMSIKFGGIGERQVLTVSASLPRTPITARHNPLEYDDDDDEATSTNDMPVRRAIDIQVGLEKKRQRRREQLYRKQHRKSTKEKRPPIPGRGAERMRDVGLQMAAHKGKTTAFNPFHVPATPDQANMHVLSV